MSGSGDFMPAHRQLFYDGRWHEPHGGYRELFSPSDGRPLGVAAEADSMDVDLAVAAAGRAFAHWRLTEPLERQERLRALATAVRAHAEELARIDAINCGSPLRELLRDAAFGADYIDYFAGIAHEAKGDVLPSGGGALRLVAREPVGVCARILAYNHPLMFLCMKLAPAIAAGNAVIMKPPVQAPLSAYRLMELAGDILPPGVLNIVTGGTEAGTALTAHPQVPLVSLIGGAATGRAVMRGAADRLKRVIFELGGKNAMIVWPDADLSEAVEAAVRGMNFGWAGQSCGSTSRLFLHEDIHDRFVDRLAEAMAVYRPGLPEDPATTMGTLISAEQRAKVEHYVGLARQAGATVRCGGRRPEDPALASGHYYEPTLLTNVTAAMAVAREEIFGPVLSVLRWRDEAAMLAEVNDVVYGLTAAIWTRDLATAMRASRAVEAGFLWINDSARHFIGAPYGGVKQSGIGREESLDELLEFTDLKTINFRF